MFTLKFIERIAQDQNHQFWTFQFIFWGGWASFYLIFQFWPPVIFADAIAALVLTTGLRFLYQFFSQRHFMIRTLVVLIGSALVGLAWNVFKRHLELVSFGEETEAVYKELGAIGYYTSQYIGLSFWIMVLWSFIYLGLTLYHMLQEERAANIEARAMAHEAQLRMLRYQLNPHFLFNTLNAISTLILVSENQTANSMLQKLSNFLRYSLDKDPLQKVDLQHEINTLKLYLEIEQVRFEDRLTVEFNIESQASSAMILSMLLQPLVENSIKYAVAQREEGGKITIGAKVFAGDLLLSVQDDGPGIEMVNGELPTFTGVGIINTQERLEELYGPSHSCSIKNVLPHGLRVEIRIPFEPMKSSTEESQSTDATREAL
jgi:sensor histidine kinase YesM